jgi:hypothetical protein
MLLSGNRYNRRPLALLDIVVAVGLSCNDRLPNEG